MKNIAVLMGGYSSECEISLRSGAVVTNALDKSLYRCYPISILENGWFYTDNDGNKYIIDKNDFSINVGGEKVTFDCCYNTIHGTPGEDGKIQAYLELLGIPQTSCGSYESAITFNKRDCLAVLQPWEITTGEHIYLNEHDDIDLDKIIARVGLPFFVKANRSGSSYGVSKVYSKEEMPAALDFAFKVDHQVIVESYLEGMEVSVAVYRSHGEIKSFPPTEIVTDNDFFDYEAKYEGKSTEITPARISEDELKELQQISIKIYRVLQLDGIARADFIYHKGIPHFIEMNTNPGMSKESIVPQQITASGSSLTKILTEVIEDAINRK
ncbi:MAG: D-alanine--D-alanine ligase [Nonlabens sp.]